MDKQEIYAYLRSHGIEFEVTEHPAVFHMDELSEVNLSHPEAEAKNLFLRDDKKLQYYLVSVKGDQKVNLKELRQKNNTRALSFASEEELMEILHLSRGAVSPFGLLNDTDRKAELFLDESFLKDPGLIGIHPNDNTATIVLRTQDLLRLIREHGNPVRILKTPGCPSN